MQYRVDMSNRSEGLLRKFGTPPWTPTYSASPASDAKQCITRKRSKETWAEADPSTGAGKMVTLMHAM